MSDAKLISAHVCMDCGAVYDRPTQCPFNGADSPTIPVEKLAGEYARATGTLRRARRWLLAAEAQATGGRRSTIEGHIRDVDDALRGSP